MKSVCLMSLEWMCVLWVLNMECVFYESWLRVNVCLYILQIDVVSLILFKKISQVWMLPKHKITKILCQKWVNVPSLHAVCIFKKVIAKCTFVRHNISILQALYVFKGLSMAQDEVHWVLRHVANPPSRRHNVKLPQEDFHDR